MTDAQAVGSPRRLLLVHAHPDDETLMTGGVVAAHLAAGDQVCVVTCTLGEEGEVIGEQWAQLVADGGADQLGGYRILELTRALAALSPPGAALEPLFLGGAGRWRDSGMAGSPAARNPRAFVNADIAESTEALARIITGFRPQVVVGYDPAGTYGHPDHMRVHEICSRAIDFAESASAPGERWSVTKHYWSVTEHTALTRGLAAITEVPSGWRLPEPGELPSHADATVTTEIDVSAVYSCKVAALRAHATQVTVSPSRSEYALSNNVIQPIFEREHFILVRGEFDASGPRETDLFAGLTW